jgi:acyl-CoA synthetase (NDP forming)
MRPLGDFGVSFAHVFSGGFFEANLSQLEANLIFESRKNNIRILGPNCMGIFNPPTRQKFIFQNNMLEILKELKLVSSQRNF